MVRWLRPANYGFMSALFLSFGFQKEQPKRNVSTPGTLGQPALLIHTVPMGCRHIWGHMAQSYWGRDQVEGPTAGPPASSSGRQLPHWLSAPSSWTGGSTPTGSSCPAPCKAHKLPNVTVRTNMSHQDLTAAGTWSGPTARGPGIGKVSFDPSPCQGRVSTKMMSSTALPGSRQHWVRLALVLGTSPPQGGVLTPPSPPSLPQHHKCGGGLGSQWHSPREEGEGSGGVGRAYPGPWLGSCCRSRRGCRAGGHTPTRAGRCPPRRSRHCRSQ